MVTIALAAFLASAAFAPIGIWFLAVLGYGIFFRKLSKSTRPIWQAFAFGLIYNAIVLYWSGKYVGAHVYARELSKDKPKRQWRTAALGAPLLDDQGQNTPEHRLERVHTGNSVRSTLRNLALFAEIVGEPFFVEVSKKDLDDISNGRPLTKVIYLIGETRKAKGFAEIFPESK